MARQQQQQKKRFIRPTNLKCSFCETKREPDYKEVEGLESFVTGRGKLLGRVRTGLCQKHQRRLSMAVKRARHLARLPFVSSVNH